ncbi:MAG: hypothetical protein HQK63_09790 [Desulfamplus sp.]|nr:hypothetical protein [Desulfamplus sp.]
MRLKVTAQGVTIPKKFFENIDEVEIRKKHNLITLVPKVGKNAVFNIGSNPIECGTPDASENLDMYIYGTNK